MHVEGEMCSCKILAKLPKYPFDVAKTNNECQMHVQSSAHDDNAFLKCPWFNAVNYISVGLKRGSNFCGAPLGPALMLSDNRRGVETSPRHVVHGWLTATATRMPLRVAELQLPFALRTCTAACLLNRVVSSTARAHHSSSPNMLICRCCSVRQAVDRNGVPLQQASSYEGRGFLGDMAKLLNSSGLP